MLPSNLWHALVTVMATFTVRATVMSSVMVTKTVIATDKLKGHCLGQSQG